MAVRNRKLVSSRGNWQRTAIFESAGIQQECRRLLHFASDDERRGFWKSVYANGKFIAFAAKVRPLIDMQGVQLPVSAPRGRGADDSMAHCAALDAHYVTGFPLSWE